VEETVPIRHCEEDVSPTRQSREMIEIASSRALLAMTG
jgi:hypothetical protein